MMTPCKRLYYAVEAVLYIAYHADSKPVSSREIARQQHLPDRHLEQIMQLLVHGGILRGVRGPRGGYQLEKSGMKASVRTLYDLLNEDDVIAELPPTTELGNRIVRPMWETMFGHAKEQMESVTIADLCQQAKEQKIPHNRPYKL